MKPESPVVRVVHYYKIYFRNDSFVEKLKQENIPVKPFSFFDKPDAATPISTKKTLILNEFKCLLKLIFHFFGFRNEKVFCFRGHYSFFVITKLFGWMLGKNYHLYVYNFYLHSLSKNPLMIAFLRFFLKSKKITLIVQSPDEVNFFQKLALTKVYFVPYCASFVEKEIVFQDQRDGYLFSGGYSNRDYALLIKCARSNPDMRFVFVASSLNRDIDDFPLNATLYKDLPREKFNELMAGASGVIIPLKEDVGASGQMVSISAMQMKKPVIYSDISAVNYYFIPYKTGIPYTLGDIDSINQAVRTLFEPGFDREKMAEESFQYFQSHFTFERRNSDFIHIILNP